MRPRDPTYHERRRQGVFDRLVTCAVKGERCPITGPGFRSDDVSALAHEGRIRVEITAHNWRTVTILEGPHAGKTTKPNPMPGRQPYVTVDGTGTRRRGIPVQAPQRIAP